MRQHSIQQAATIFIFSLALGMASCAISAPDPKFAKEGKDYELSWSQNDESSTFGIKLTSKNGKPLCISVDDWPDKFGQVSGGAGRASLKAVDFSAPSVVTNFGFCAGKPAQSS